MTRSLSRSCAAAAAPCSRRRLGCRPAGGRDGAPRRRPARPGAPLTLYSGQHVQTTQALVNAFEKKTGITVNVRFDDEDVLADQIVDRGRALAGRRVLHRELAARSSTWPPSTCSRPIEASTLAQTPVEVQLAQRHVGRRLGPGERHRLQHLAAQAEPAADLGHAAGPAAVEGQDRHRRRRDRLPAHRDLGGAHLRHGGRPQVARGGSRPTRGTTSTPTTRRSPTRSTGARSPSASSTSTTGTASGPRSGASNMHSAIAYFAPHDVGYVVDVSGAGHPAVLAEPGGGAALRRLLHLGAGAGDHRPQRQLRVPHRLGGDHGAAGDPVRPAAAQHHHHRPAGHRCRGDQAAAGGAALVTRAAVR